MAYKRNYNRKRGPMRKRKYGGRSRFKRVGASVGSAAYTALKMAKRLKDMVNVEYKMLDTASSVNNVDWTGTLIYPLNSISQGDTDSNRIGDSIKLQNYVLRYRCVWNPALTYEQIRVIVFEDKQCRFSQGSLTMSSLLNNNATAYAPLGAKVYDNRFMTKIHYDQTINLHANHPVDEKDVVIPLNWHTQFAGDTSRRTGDLVLAVISNITPGVNAPFFDYVTRITYTDN